MTSVPADRRGRFQVNLTPSGTSTHVGAASYPAYPQSRAKATIYPR
jgi:hypothetical protein